MDVPQPIEPTACRHSSRTHLRPRRGAMPERSSAAVQRNLYSSHPCTFFTQGPSLVDRFRWACEYSDISWKVLTHLFIVLLCWKCIEIAISITLPFIYIFNQSTSRIIFSRAFYRENEWALGLDRFPSCAKSSSTETHYIHCKCQQPSLLYDIPHGVQYCTFISPQGFPKPKAL